MLSLLLPSLLLLSLYPPGSHSGGHKLQCLPRAEEALPDRPTVMRVDNEHAALAGQPTLPPFPAHLETVLFGMGCFWGAERLMWKQEGIFSTQVGYSGGFTRNPTYEDVCTGKTGHVEVVRVVFDPAVIAFDQLLKLFWENHDVTQGFRQGGDLGTQYRSVVFTTTEDQLQEARASRQLFQAVLLRQGGGTVTTEVAMAKEFFYAENYHQQYLFKNPMGYCGLSQHRFHYPGRQRQANEL